MASTESDYLRALYQSWSDRIAANPEMGMEAMRDIFEEWHLPTREPEGVSYAEVDIDGVPAVWCLPEGASADQVLLYSHGGGGVVGSMHTHRKLAGHLARAAGTRALVLDYRLAPENPCPAGVDDCVTAYRWLLAQGFEAPHIATAGDSAGANLAISAVLKLRDAGDALPGAIVALSPYLDMELSGAAMEENAETEALVSRPLMEAMVESYLCGLTSVTDPSANPLHADLTGLPPLYIAAGDAEMLRDDGTRFAALAEKAGVEVLLEVEPEMQHVFQFMAGRAPEADAAVARIGAWVRPRLGL